MEIVHIPIKKISPSPFQPRETFDKDELEDLAESIKEFDLLNPILIRSTGDDTYQIIAGERRWRAAQFVGMKKIYAIVKDIDDSRQRIESLIENIHRKDLYMIEKGRGVLEIFRAEGIIQSPKSLANIINSIQRKKSRNLSLIPTEEKIDEISTKIHIKPNTVRLWLEAASVEPEIIQKELKKTPEDRIPERVLSRLSTIADPDLQRSTYAKIVELDMGKDQASKFVSQIKKIPSDERDAILTKGIPVEVIGDTKDGYSIEIPKDEIDAVKKAVAVGKKKSAEILSKPIIEERGRHRRNLQGHSKIIEMLDNLFCPWCGKPASTHLRWTCHSDETWEEAREQAKENYEDASKREEVNGRFMPKRK
ncbi:MAG: ParB/RepB/Spo0J family partition protein [Candidatus Heimdallarchaeaceae archaeon]|jgi:ParB family chromosome partitioning protein